MLNGVAPILIFTLYEGIVFDLVSKIPVVKDLTPKIGIPIPIYLDERLTGVIVESENKAIEARTSVQTDKEGLPRVDQTGIDSTVSINLKARKDSLLLSALLAMNDLIFDRLVSGRYSVGYLNGSTVIVDGLFSGFTQYGSSDDSLIRATLTLSKSNKGSLLGATAGAAIAVLQKVTGETPS